MEWVKGKWQAQAIFWLLFSLLEKSFWSGYPDMNFWIIGFILAFDIYSSRKEGGRRRRGGGVGNRHGGGSMIRLHREGNRRGCDCLF
ncbi:hypothetical protein QBC44DRAFT_88889 [Cladorrhinum sp. PSN332]|nr:hypothetical protein QBC44DRAFT_88889 [Cladorrhinum sp. PSN332]